MGSKMDPNSYRPISVISHFAKFLEKFMQYQLLLYLNAHDLIMLSICLLERSFDTNFITESYRSVVSEY